jgi:hypothetical protein
MYKYLFIGLDADLFQIRIRYCIADFTRSTTQKIVVNYCTYITLNVHHKAIEQNILD